MTPMNLHLAGQGETVYFSHANGFPAGVYLPVLKRLNEQFNVHGIQSRATHQDIDDPTHTDWHLFADDLIKQVEAHGKPVIAIGHSLGASSTVLAATKRPDLFKALVLIEPAMLSFSMSMLFKWLPKKVIYDSKLIKGTLNKPDTWNSREAFLSYIKRFKGYKKFNEQSYKDFSDHAIRESGDEFKLVYPKKWEAHNYTLAPYLMKELAALNTLKVPTLAIRGKPNMFFTDKLWKQWQSKQPNALFLEDGNYSHLFPLEGPDGCMSLIQEGLTEMKIITS